MANPYKAPDPMYGMAFTRSQQGWTKPTPAVSAFRCFDVHCVKCGSYPDSHSIASSINRM
jgi:hypothetical protein